MRDEAFEISDTIGRMYIGESGGEDSTIVRAYRLGRFLGNPVRVADDVMPEGFDATALTTAVGVVSRWFYPLADAADPHTGEEAIPVYVQALSDARLLAVMFLWGDEAAQEREQVFGPWFDAAEDECRKRWGSDALENTAGETVAGKYDVVELGIELAASDDATFWAPIARGES